MNAARRKLAYRAGLAAGSLLLLGQLWSGYQAVQQSLIRVTDPATLVLAVGLVILANSLQMAAWSVIMHGLGAPLPIPASLSGYMLSSLARYIPGGVWGYVSRSQWLYQVHAVPYALSHVGSLLEMIGLVSAALVLTATFLSLFSSGWLRIALILATLLLPFAMWLGLMLFRRWLALKATASDRWAAVTRYELPLLHWAGAIGLHILLWISLGGAMLWTAQALDLPGAMGILEATSIYATAWLAGFLLAVVPAGLGIRETALSGLLAVRLGMLGGAASAVSVTLRLITLLAELVSLSGWWAATRFSSTGNEA